MAYFLIIVITIWTLVLANLIYYVVHPLEKGKFKWIVGLTFLLFYATHLIVPVVYRDRGPLEIPSLWDEIYFLSYLTFGFFFMAFSATLFLNFFRFTRHVSDRAREKATRQDIVSSRRQFWSQGVSMGVLGLSGLSSGFGLYQALQPPTTRKIRIPISNLHPDLEGFKIAQITDVHIGPTLRREWMQLVVDQTNALEPDMIAVTGDIIDGYVSQLGHDIEPLRGLKSPYGNYLVTGNHEYYWNLNEWTDKFSELGLDILTNENRILEIGKSNFMVAGVPDVRESPRRGTPSDPALAIQAKLETDFKLLLAHQPKSCIMASEAGYDLQISGHTHGGQTFPWNLLLGFVHPVVRGLEKYNGMWVYVSCGTGYWGPPLRLGIPSEITLIELTGKSTPAKA